MTRIQGSLTPENSISGTVAEPEELVSGEVWMSDVSTGGGLLSAEVVDAREAWDGEQFDTLGEAIRTQLFYVWDALDGKQPVGDYLTEVPDGYATEEYVNQKIIEAELGIQDIDLSGYAKKDEIPTKVSQLENDEGYLTEHQDISGKLDASELPNAINTALAQAKASGEFDGKDGKDGIDGVDGKDGYIPIKGVDYFDGKNGIDGKDGVAVRNILDNSDFANPVNQRGKTEYKGQVYTIDRWSFNRPSYMLTVEEGHIRISDNPDSTNTKVCMLQQFIPITPDIAGKVVTLVARVKGIDVRININDQEKPSGGGYDGISSYTTDDDYHIITATTTVPTDGETFFVALQFKNAANVICEWIALYEGVYTSDTAPEYQPKGYATELIACQRYFLQLGTSFEQTRIACGIADTNQSAVVFVPIPISMRIQPTLTIADPSKIYFQAGNVNGIRNFASNWVYCGNTAIGLSFTFPEGVPVGSTAVMIQESPTDITLSADL